MNSPTEVIQQLLLLLYMYSVITQKAFADDPIVFKDFPANVTCRRTREQRLYERNEASTENYRACYDYEIVNEECVVTNPIVDDISPSVVVEDSTKIYRIETPLLVTNMYPKSLVCFFVIGRRRNGFFYQYFQSTLFNQDLEGMLYINDSGTSVEVVGGLCQDFFEFREKQFDNQVPINELVTCSNITDPRIQFEVDVASALTLVFKSNDENEFQGIDFYILEIDPSEFTSKRKKRETEAKQGLKGPIGDTGRRGAPGKQGPAGKIGRDGLNGLKGERGILGIMGPEGDIGLPGEIGMPGDIGPTGPKGMSCTCPSFKNCKPGRPGRKGANGSRGFRGDTGPRGPRGQPGKPGDKGFPGSKGEKGNKGLNGAKGLPGPRGDQGPTGSRGKHGPPGPPGLGGCPLPTNNKLSRRIREVGHIFSTTSELYDSLGLEDQMSADEFYDYIMKNEKDAVPVHLYSDENRAARSTESSTDCSGTLVIPGPKGEPGVPGLPGEDGIKGEAGIPGIDGTSGKAGEPGIPGSRGSKGSRGDKGPRGPKGENGNIGPRGYPGDCQCYQGQGEVITYSQSTSENGIPGRPGPRGPRGPKGFPGSVGEKGSLGSPGRRGPKGLKGDKGVSGRTGSYGKPGSKGRLGQQGIPGPTGPPGPRGPPGCVCNNLIILLDKYGFVRRNTRVPDLNIFNLARIRPNTKILDLPISDGDWNERTNQSTGLFFKPNITCIRNDFGPAKIGLKGEQGLPGSPGANGDLGIPGMPGRDGIPGIKGKHGDPGLFGVKGEKGLRGKVGSKGVTGVVGRQGLPGNNSDCILGERSQYLIAIECPTGCPNGLDGEIGDRGDPGLKGSSGPRGLRGAKGVIGPRGVAGLPGSQGDKGSVGKPGVKGPPGLRGLPGAVGPAGPTGPPGPRDTCPEYDGVDFNMFMSASKKDMEKMKYLIETSNRKVATEMTKEEFPLLRELAKLITKGYRFRRRQPCQPLKAPANGKIRYSRTGTRAYFTCKQGFNVKGENTLVCQNEKWNSQPPVCYKSTLSLP